MHASTRNRNVLLTAASIAKALLNSNVNHPVIASHKKAGIGAGFLS